MTALTDHLASRGLDVSKYLHVFLDEQEQVVSFPLYTLTGKLVGYQNYRPGAPKQNYENPTLAKYFTKVNKHDVALWGMEKYDPSRAVTYLVEGVFDCVSLHNLGVNALAVLCNDPKHMAGQFRALGRRTVAVCDGDGAGSKLAKFCDAWVQCPSGKDPNDLTTDELKEVLRHESRQSDTRNS